MKMYVITKQKIDGDAFEDEIIGFCRSRDDAVRCVMKLNTDEYSYCIDEVEEL